VCGYLTQYRRYLEKDSSNQKSDAFSLFALRQGHFSPLMSYEHFIDDIKRAFLILSIISEQKFD